MTTTEWVVIEKSFKSERVVYGPTKDKAAAEKVKSEHAARRVEESK